MSFKKTITFICGDLGQWLSLFVCCGGIIFDLVDSFTIGGITISIACILWGISTKIKYYTRRDEYGQIKAQQTNSKKKDKDKETVKTIESFKGKTPTFEDIKAIVESGPQIIKRSSQDCQANG